MPTLRTQWLLAAVAVLALNACSPAPSLVIHGLVATPSAPAQPSPTVERTAPASLSQPSSGSPQPTGSAPSADRLADTFGNWRFFRPAAWNEIHPHVWTAPTGPRLFLSNASISDPCASAPQGDCFRPLAELPANGILVTFEGAAVLSPPNPSPNPSAAPAGGTCKKMAGDVQMSVLLPGFGISACLRGPDTSTNEAAFRALVASMRQTTRSPRPLPSHSP